MRLSQLALGLLLFAAFTVGIFKVRSQRTAHAAPRIARSESADQTPSRSSAQPSMISFAQPAAAMAQSAPSPATPADEDDSADGEDDEMQVTIVDNNQVIPARSNIDDKTLTAAVMAVVPALNRCYRDQLSFAAGLRGDIKIEMTISPQPGSDHPLIEDAAVDADEFYAPLFEQCMLNAMMELKLPQPSGRLYVSYPFTLDPGDDKDDDKDDDDVAPTDTPAGKTVEKPVAKSIEKPVDQSDDEPEETTER